MKTKQDMREVRIPALSSSNSALDYHQVPIDLNDTRSGELLVTALEFGIATRSAYFHADPPYYRSFPSALQQVYVRESVAKRMVAVNQWLRDYGVELLALDGWRPIELQADLWAHFVQKARETLVNPTELELDAFAGQFCSDPRRFDPDDFTTRPVHNTGGAIDLTLRSLNDGRELWMGSIFDDADSISGTRYFEDDKHTSQSAFEARRSRRLLYHAMAHGGFVNYPHEFWHFDFGTQMGVMNSGSKAPAFYGRTNLPA